MTKSTMLGSVTYLRVGWQSNCSGGRTMIRSPSLACCTDSIWLSKHLQVAPVPEHSGSNHGTSCHSAIGRNTASARKACYKPANGRRTITGSTQSRDLQAWRQACGSMGARPPLCQAVLADAGYVGLTLNWRSRILVTSRRVSLRSNDHRGLTALSRAAKSIDTLHPYPSHLDGLIRGPWLTPGLRQLGSRGGTSTQLLSKLLSADLWGPPTFGGHR